MFLFKFLVYLITDDSYMSRIKILSLKADISEYSLYPFSLDALCLQSSNQVMKFGKI